MATEQSVLKVSDLVKFSEKDYLETKKTLGVMDEMVREYVKGTDSLDELENLKRRFNGYLVYLAGYYSKIRCFRENFEFLEAQRKRIKSEAIEFLIKNSEEKISQSAAEKVVYSHPYYIERITLIEQLKRFFYLVDLSYQNYQDVQRSIYQSISVLSKERQATIS
jgi:DNA-binding SARP family transcriptional activator